MEYLNLYDKNGNLLNEKGIRGKRTDKLVGIVIIFIENSKGEFLIQKTSKQRNSTFATTGGHVGYGSNFYKTVINEVKEELGIDISNDRVVEVRTFFREFYIQKVYYLKKDININDINVKKDEVEYVKWLDINTINDLINDNQFREGHVEGYKHIINLRK